MKTAKIIIIVLLIIFIGSCGYVAVQPNSYDINRTRVINAPAELLFNNINDFKNWESWSPWVEKDASIQITYPEQTSGVDGAYSWTSDDGVGSMKNLMVSPYDSISQEMQFDNFPPSNVYWQFEKVDTGTKVTWGMKSNDMRYWRGQNDNLQRDLNHEVHLQDQEHLEHGRSRPAHCRPLTFPTHDCRHGIQLEREYSEHQEPFHESGATE